jgi:hypothetical protein
MDTKYHISKFRRAKLIAIVGMVFCGLSVVAQAAGTSKTNKQQPNIIFILVDDMDHRETFCIRTDKGKTIVEAATSAGLIYGAQGVADGEFKLGQVEKPDFDIRGTTLCLMPHRYTATLSPELYPWQPGRYCLLRRGYQSGQQLTHRKISIQIAIILSARKSSIFFGQIF